jgi:uncharacterized protein YdiU (UPF0061 family)
MLCFNDELAAELGLEAEVLKSDYGARIFSGAEVPPGAEPVAQAYAGHQFGNFVPQLGDGRAVLLGEVIDREGRRRDIALKGSGRTPFSRGGDGKAAVGPMLREYVIGESMHALGIPTTRALAVVRTGEDVIRERILPGAVLVRVAASHVRVGTFQYFAARGDIEKVRMLAEYAINRHDPGLAARTDRYLDLLRAVASRQARLIAQWMLHGFIHGVMNTDNMAVSGETIDYGPCAFIEAYSPGAVFSSIDRHGRYAYGNQPAIAQWNLARFAETLLPLINPEAPEAAVPAAQEVLQQFAADYEAAWLSGMRAKLGLQDAAEGDQELATDWLALLEAQNVDFTLAWRRLGGAAAGNTQPFDDLFRDAHGVAFWMDHWRARIAQESITPKDRETLMNRVNPIYIPRNHRVEEALAAASDRGDMEPFNRLLEVLENPFEERPGFEGYAQPAPPEVTACYRTFCGT